MKTLLLFLSLCAASAAPLQSPRAASVPRSAPMSKSVTAPASEPAPPMWMEVVGGIDFFGCTNVPGCQLWFNQHVSHVQLAGTELTIEFADVANASGWTRAAWFGAGPVDRISEFNWFQPEDQRPPQRYFRSQTVIPILPASATAAPAIWVNPNLKGAWAQSRKR